MKKRISLLMAVALCMLLALPAMATEFVPSISYKDGPGVRTAIQGVRQDLEDGENVTDCVVITSIIAAREKTTDITQESRDLLLEVYEALSDGSMSLPLEGNYVIRELVDISHKQSACVQAADHTHDAQLKQEGFVVSVIFDLGVKAGQEVEVLSYQDGQWAEIVSAVNNGDGTVTCIMEHFCPVAFCLDADAQQGPAATGDVAGQNLLLWIIVLVAALAAIIVLAVNRRKLTR